MPDYYELIPHSSGKFDADKGWAEEARNSFLYRCGHRRPGHVGPIDVVVRNPNRRSAVDFAMGFPSFAVVSTTLIDALGWKEIGDHFAIGSLSASDGTKSTKYVTLVTRGSYVYTRGDAQSPRRLCPECGRLILLATGEPYLCAVEPSQYLQTSDGDLTVRADVFERKLLSMPLPMVRVLPLDVKDTPLDGLPRTTKEIVAMLQAKPR